MDRRGESLMSGIFVLIIVIVTFSIMMLTMGTMLDAFLFEFGNLGIPLEGVFMDAIEKPLKIAETFYYLPVIFILTFTVWVFKVIIFKHKYTRYDEDEEW